MMEVLKGYCPFHKLHGRMYTLSLVRDNMFALNHLKTLFSSRSVVWKSSCMLLCEKKRFVSSANIMGSNILDTLHKSFTYIMKRSDPKIDSSGTPQIISSLDVFIAPACIFPTCHFAELNQLFCTYLYHTVLFLYLSLPREW